ncbi:phosphoglycerate mutase family protein [Colwellia psychrerythraea]|uniref:Phosphoglycerate mutase n=1 Tax=Colwellia psychrerythraea TaxID=28229 RepID=A0A099KSW9_COLPS|nr:phosphoglycerate mutase family protein [Colwellia psychrerythraea]KGJ92753.1 Phosphoglycerate mutase [Colwellia psychrerythraea]
MKKFSLMIASILLTQPCLASDNFTLYLVRHAEKQADVKNPPLTQCGEERADQLATLLSTANIKSVYSTDYQRTMSTAKPVSSREKLAIENYNPGELEQFSLLLKERKENALIVGHSNTTPQLTQLLSNQKVDDITEKEYQMLYQVQFIEGKSQLTLFNQPLSCGKP